MISCHRIFQRSVSVHFLLTLGVVATVLFDCPAALALGLGILVAIIAGRELPPFWNHASHYFLQGAIIAMGAGMDLPEVLRVGLNAFGVTLIGITMTLLIGEWIGRRLGVPRHTRLLISAGTAICGGSAIAALAGVLKPQRHETAVSLGIVFSLNAVALILFPLAGHLLALGQTAFGWWAALGIHDTSSVVGASLTYGHEALKLATTIKLARALWIVPVSFVFAQIEARMQRHNAADASAPAAHSTLNASFPWFILGFILMALVRWWAPGFAHTGDMLAGWGRQCLSAALFLIGAGLNPSALKRVGFAPTALGISLWLIACSGSLLFVLLAKN